MDPFTIGNKDVCAKTVATISKSTADLKLPRRRKICLSPLALGSVPILGNRRPHLHFSMQARTPALLLRHPHGLKNRPGSEALPVICILSCLSWSLFPVPVELGFIIPHSSFRGGSLKDPRPVAAPNKAVYHRIRGLTCAEGPTHTIDQIRVAHHRERGIRSDQEIGQGIEPQAQPIRPGGPGTWIVATRDLPQVA